MIYVRNFILIQFVKKKYNFIAAKNNFKNHYYIESDTISKKKRRHHVNTRLTVFVSVIFFLFIYYEFWKSFMK